MKPVKIYILVIVLVCSAAYGGYIFGSHQRQKKQERQFELLAYSTFATEVNIDVQLINMIEAKKYKEAANLLENFIDVTLASLSLYDTFATDYPNKFIFSAIDAAKKHREQHPSHKIDSNLSNGVARAFKITEGKRL